MVVVVVGVVVMVQLCNDESSRPVAERFAGLKKGQGLMPWWKHPLAFHTRAVVVMVSVAAVVGRHHNVPHTTTSQ